MSRIHVSIFTTDYKSLKRSSILTDSNAVKVLFSHHSIRVHALLRTNVKHRTSETQTPRTA